MAIKELITLEGSEEVKKQLADLSKSGEAFVNSVNNLGTSSNPQLQQYFETIKTGTAANVEHGKSVSELTTLYHLLHPALTQAGVSMGEFRGFAVAAHLGVIGLAGAIGATLALSLAKLGDGAAAARQRLDELFQSSAVGKNAFDNLNNAAGNSGTTVEKILPAFEGFTKAWDTFVERNRTFKFVSISPEDLPNVQSLQDRVKAFQTLFEALRGGGADEATATKAIQDFNAELLKTGTVTGQMVDKLLTAAPGALKILSDAMGKGSSSAAALTHELDLAPEKLDKFSAGLVRLAPDAQKAFDSKPIQSFSANITESFSTLENIVGGFFQKAQDDGKNSQTQIAGVFSELVANGTSVFTQLKQTFDKSPIDASAWSVEASQSFGALTTAAETTFNEIKRIFSGSPIDPTTWMPTITSSFDSIIAGAQATWNSMNSTFSTSPIDASGWTQDASSAFDTIVSLARSAWDQIQSIFSNPINLSTTGGFAPNIGGAEGGYVRGPGTTTSDSIMAWLSDREFVINAKAVGHYGPDFFAALNAMKLPKDFSFSMGGLVRSMMGPMPRMAGGGMVAAGTPINIVIGQNKFSLSASEETAKKLKQFSISSQLSSTGRKPSWVR